MISSSLMSKDKKEFVSGATCEMMEDSVELRQCQDAHLGRISLTVVCPALGTLVLKRKKWVTRMEREGAKGKKLGNKDPRLCNG